MRLNNFGVSMGLLENLSLPNGVRDLSVKQLNSLSQEIREKIISVTDSNGGHLSSNLGIVDTTVALYNVFDFTKDKLIFDVGHQCYAHKILSDRLSEFDSLRTKDGISGFLSASESPFDLFTSGHAGTSVAQAIGLSEARDKLNQDFTVVTVVGDGSLVNGLNLEAFSESQTKPKNLIVILNDNGMSISKNRNGFYRYISKRTVSKDYIKSKRALKRVFGDSFITKFLVGTRNYLKRLIYKENYFERFGFKYVGVVDGNDVGELTTILKKVKEASKSKAVFLHVKTTKGKGLERAEKKSDLYHGVDKSCITDKEKFSTKLGEVLNGLIKENDKIVAVTSGMKDGTGLKVVEDNYPKNFYDVGIAEEYAVTFASGLAKGGLKPVVCIYSTFLGRAYDEIFQNVCIDNLPVVFCVDRAGFVGEDGVTHQGLYDLSYLSHVPNLTILSPGDAKELESALKYALSLNSPVVIRYSKYFQGGLELPSVEYSEKKWTIVKEGKDGVILAVGSNPLKIALEIKEKAKTDFAVVNARMVKPLDNEILDSFKGKKVVTIEENSVIGGFSSMVNSYYLNTDTTIYNFGAKDQFVSHAEIEEQMKNNGLEVENILRKVD